MLTGGATDSEAAVIVAALEQFIADTAPPPAEAPAPSRWQRAALQEGIAARQLSGRGWGTGAAQATVARRHGSG
jgi:hypothetical protein